MKTQMKRLQPKLSGSTENLPTAFHQADSQALDSPTTKR